MNRYSTTACLLTLSLLALLSFCALQGNAQTLGDFRSAGSGPWNAASTWERFNGTNFVAAVSSPSAADGVITIRNGHAVTATTAVTADQVQVATGGTLTITSVTFTVVDGPGVDLSVTGTLSLNGVLAFAGSVEVSGTLSCTAGNISGAGSFTLMSGSTTNFQFTSSFTLNTALSNNGTIIWTGGVLDGTGSVTNGNGATFNRTAPGVNHLQVNFTNPAGGTFNYSGLGEFSSLVTINNAGAININSGTWRSSSTLVNSGAIAIAGGATWTIESLASVDLNAGTVLSGSGNIIQSSGTVNQNIPWTNSTFNFTKTGGVWNNSASNPTVFAVGSALTWNGGTFAGPAPYTINSGFTATFSPSSSFSMSSALTNNGTINWTSGVLDGGGTLTNTNGATINRTAPGVNHLQVNFTNPAGGTFNYSGLGEFSSLVTINNAGAINITSGTWRSSSTLVNSGTIAIAGGATWTIESLASVDLNAGTVLSGNGNIIQSSGTVNQNIPWTNSTFNFTKTGGVWNNSASNPTIFALGSALTWNGGTFAGPAPYTINSGLTATFSSLSSTITMASALTNNGTINWTSGVLDGGGTLTNTNGATINRSAPGVDHLQVNFTNPAGGTFNCSGLGVFSASGAVNNAGAININSGTWRSSSTLVNSGAIAIAGSATWTIELLASVDLNAGTVLSGSGNIIHSAGIVNQNIPWTNSTFNFTKSGGVWNNSASNPTVFAVGSALIWNGGTFAGPAPYTINSGLTATFSPSSSFSMASALTNNGTINWTSGVLDGGGTLTNSNGGTINRTALGVNHLQVNFTNQAGGTFNHSSSGEFSASGAVNNAGTINALLGTYTFNANSTHTGTLNISAGATMNFATPTVGGTVNNAGTFSGNINAYNGPNFTNNGSVTLTNLPFNGSAAQALNGSGTIANLTIDNASGVSLGGDQSITNTLTLTTGELALGANDLFVESVLPAAVSGGSANGFVATTGSGALHRQVNGANYVFPVGVPSSYLPLTLGTTAGGQERFAVRVQNGVSREYTTPGNASGALVNSDVVGRTWVVLEQNAGGSTADITLQWNTADELPSFGRALSAVARYDGTNWITSSLAASGGAGPFTRSISGITSFREFCVTDGDALLNDIGTSIATPTRDDLSIFPNPCNDVLYVEPSSGGAIRNLQLVDLSGRAVSTSVQTQAGRTSLATNHLPNGAYILEVMVEGDGIRRSAIVVSH